MTRKIDEVLQAAVARGDVPGVVALAAGDDGVLYEGAAGRRAADAGDPITPDTMLRIASMTKMVTTTAALQLSGRGRLELDAPVETYRPEFADLQVLEGFEGGAPRLRPAWHPRHRPAVDHAHGGAGLLVLEQRDRPLRAGHRHAEYAVRQRRHVHLTAAVRSGNALRVRDQRRLARPCGRGGQRAVAGRILPGQHHRPAGHDQHHGKDD